MYDRVFKDNVQLHYSPQLPFVLHGVEYENHFKMPLSKHVCTSWDQKKKNKGNYLRVGLTLESHESNTHNQLGLRVTPTGEPISGLTRI